MGVCWEGKERRLVGLQGKWKRRFVEAVFFLFFPSHSPASVPFLPPHSLLSPLHFFFFFFLGGMGDGLNMISRGREYNWPFRGCSPQSHWDSCLRQIIPELTLAYIHNVQAFSFVFVPVFSYFSGWGKTRKGKRRETEELQALLVCWGCAWVW